jgi:hypothetical protein
MRYTFLRRIDVEKIEEIRFKLEVESKRYETDELKLTIKLQLRSQMLSSYASFVFWDITPYSSLKVRRRFGGSIRRYISEDIIIHNQPTTQAMRSWNPSNWICVSHWGFSNNILRIYFDSFGTARTKVGTSLFTRSRRVLCPGSLQWSSVVQPAVYFLGSFVI